MILQKLTNNEWNNLGAGPTVYIVYEILVREKETDFLYLAFHLGQKKIKVYLYGY